MTESDLPKAGAGNADSDGGPKRGLSTGTPGSAGKPGAARTPGSHAEAAEDLLHSRSRPLTFVGNKVLLHAVERGLLRSLEVHLGAVDPRRLDSMVGSAMKVFRSEVRKGSKPVRGFTRQDFREALAEARKGFEDTKRQLSTDLHQAEAALSIRREEADREFERLEEELDRVLDPRTGEVARQIQGLFAKHGVEHDALQQEIIDAMITRFRAERKKVLDLQRTQSDEELGRLQRRVAKLVSSLERTEAQLSKLAKMKGIDPGLASVYREVQGLAADDTFADVKREMLRKIFEANVELQEQIAAAGERK